jgi:prepilin-type N-terminal cleavage/methylation domain-containing protein
MGSKQNGFTLIELLIAIAFMLMLVVASCVMVSHYQKTGTGESANRILSQQGYKDIVLKGWRPFKCSSSDSMFFTDAFTATAPNGDKVSGAVCGNLFKSHTVRLD